MDAASREILLMNISPLRILVVLPMYGGSLPIGQYCASALRDLGHSVRVFDAHELYPGFTGIKKLDISPARAAALDNSFLRLVCQAVWTQAEEQQPQLVLALAQAPLDRHVLKRMRDAGMKTVMWFVEDYLVFDYWRVYAPLYDAFAVIQKEPFISMLAEIGQPRAFYLPLAALPDFHKPLELTGAEKKEYGSDISFLGAGYPNRRLAFRPLAGKDFKIWGSDWEDEDVLKHNIQRGGKRIEAEESIKIYNAAKININLHSSLDARRTAGGGDFVNPRTFELAAMGAFQLVDKRDLMADLFKPGELATFTTQDEFYAAIEHFLAHPEERKEYAERARLRVLREHTYQMRMKTLIEYMGKNCGPWLEMHEDPGFKDIAPELRKKIIELTGELGLPANAAFGDVVARLRQKKGALDDLEAAILFLDEWRKQYAK